MKRLFVFGIGGTGARVIRSLTMLFAAGVKIQGVGQVVPILIDPDIANGDLDRTVELLTHYQSIQSEYGSGFFEQKILALNQLGTTEGNIPNPDFRIPAMMNANQKFNEYIGYLGMSDENRSLMDLLFSKNNLDADMDVGFKGNPNIGSVALNQITDTNEYHSFCKQFNSGDDIFIISSIFGGTGSAGFPLLLKNFRKADSRISNSNTVKNARIGAISVLPYFKIAKPVDGAEQEVDSETFMGKAKAAMKYYNNNLTAESKLDALYYIGDYSTNNYEYEVGQASQKNNAHFVELASAAAILDFAKTTYHRKNSAVKEFGIESNSRVLTLNSLGKFMKEETGLPIIRFLTFYRFQEKGISNSVNSKTTWTNVTQGFKKEFFSQDFYNKTLKEFLEKFKVWIKELNENDVSFEPTKELSKHNRNILLEHEGLSKVSISSIVKSLNKLIIKKEYANEQDQTRFLKLFSAALKKI